MPRIRPDAGLKTADIASELKGELCGDGAVCVWSLCPIDEPEEGAVSILTETKDDSLVESLLGSPIAAILSTEKIFSRLPSQVQSSKVFILVENPYHAVLKLIPRFFKAYPHQEGISSLADVHPTAVIGENVVIHSFCSVGMEARLEDGVVLFPHVTIYPGAKIGARSIIHSGAVVREDCSLGPQSVIQNGAVIGAEGFGYIPDPEHGLVAFPQIGTVKSEERVDIGANACVDRGALGATRIGLGTKIDNLVQIGHNTKIGNHSILCGQVGVSGSCQIGSGVVLAGSVGVADHIKITDGCRVGARGGVASNLNKKGDYAGYPAVPAMRWKRQSRMLEKLPELVKEMRGLLKSASTKE